MRSEVWPGDFAITQPFGPTTLLVEPWWPARGCHWHCGVDIGLPSGTPLSAARGGWVNYIGYGLLAISIPGTNQKDWYVHIDRVASTIFLNERVFAGQLVAYSGAKVPSGGSLTGPHLHFEVQTGNLNQPDTSLDPIPILEVDMANEVRAHIRTSLALSQLSPNGDAKCPTDADVDAQVIVLNRAPQGAQAGFNGDLDAWTRSVLPPNALLGKGGTVPAGTKLVISGTLSGTGTTS